MKLYTEKKTFALLCVLGAVGVAAIIAWLVPLAAGEDMTGSGDMTPWGSYIAFFMFCDGVATGAMIVGSLPLLLGWKGYEGVSRIATTIGIAFMAITGLFVIIDLGQPFRALNMFVFGQFGSPLMWDMLSLSAFIIVGLALLVALRRGNRSASKALAGAALVLSLIVTFVMASIFGVMESHPAWHTGLLAPWFVASSLLSGAASTLLATHAFCRIGDLTLPPTLDDRLGLLMGIAASADALMLLFDQGIGLFTRSGAAFDVAMSMLTGALAPLFWGELIACVAVAVLCLVPRFRARKKTVLAASVLALLGVACKRFGILESGYVVGNLPMSVVQTGPQHFDGISTTPLYLPTTYEMLICVGFVCLAAALILVLDRLVRRAA